MTEIHRKLTAFTILTFPRLLKGVICTRVPRSDLLSCAGDHPKKLLVQIAVLLSPG